MLVCGACREKPLKPKIIQPATAESPLYGLYPTLSRLYPTHSGPYATDPLWTIRDPLRTVCDTLRTVRHSLRTIRSPLQPVHDPVRIIHDPLQTLRDPLPGPYLAGGGHGGQLPPPRAVIVEKSALFASRCPFSDAKSSSAGCPSEPLTAPPPNNFRLRTAMTLDHMDPLRTLRDPLWTLCSPLPYVAHETLPSFPAVSAFVCYHLLAAVRTRDSIPTFVRTLGPRSLNPPSSIDKTNVTYF